MSQNIEHKIVQNVDQAISVMHGVGRWLEESGQNPSKWWQPQNMNREFLLQHAEPSEFYTVLVDANPAVAAIIQDNQRNQSWQSVDKNKSVIALYIHWLCVNRQYAGRGLPKIIIDFAEQQAISKGMHLLRVDTNAQEMNLRKIYENLGFKLMAIKQEDYRQTAFYQKEC